LVNKPYQKTESCDPQNKWFNRNPNRMHPVRGYLSSLSAAHVSSPLTFYD
jgi:hypothetical protein